jgi:hypothetical protein
MRSSAWMSTAIFMVAGLMIIGSLNLIPYAQADASAPEKVPLPQIDERHEYNVPGSQNGNSTYFNHEIWSINFIHGNSSTNIGVRNITQYIDNQTWVDYTNNIQYNISGTMYIAQFMITESEFKIGNQTIMASLKTCADFKLERSPVRYDGAVPTFDCNISFDGIRVYTNGHPDSTFDLTLIHHIRADWYRTDDKIEALFNFSNTRFYQSNGTEFNAGEPFTAEMHYRMYMTKPDSLPGQQFIAPTGHTNTTLEFNLTFNGSPLTLSELNMTDNFTIYNGSGARAWVGYSSMVPGFVFSAAVHGFPNLTYKDTISMKSDPEVTVYHDRATESNSQNNMDHPSSPSWVAIIAILAVIAVGAIGAVVYLKKRKKKQGKDVETRKKP